MSELIVSLIQTDIIWENPKENLSRLEHNINSLKGVTDLAILPEMFTTGFSMNAHCLAQENDGETVSTLQKMSKETNIAFAGSFIAKDNGRYYNRGFFITPDFSFFQDKRHLFRMSDEPKIFSSGDKCDVVNYKGWNILLQVCYDLRFPVWCRNTNYRYDLLIFTASWPKPRRSAWKTLIQARAIENSAYTIGVNRIGVDPMGNEYTGDSMIADYKGSIICESAFEKESIITFKLKKDKLKSFREKFPVMLDSDSFRIID